MVYHQHSTDDRLTDKQVGFRAICCINVCSHFIAHSPALYSVCVYDKRDDNPIRDRHPLLTYSVFVFVLLYDNACVWVHTLK